MLNIDLKGILIERKFGPIELGNKIDDVVNILGSPDSEGAFDDNIYGVSYGWFEFYFKDEKLNWFQNKHALDRNYQFDTSFHYSNQKFRVASWFENYEEDLRLNNFRKLFAQERVQFTKKPFWEAVKIITVDKTEIMFLNSNLEGIGVKSQNELIDNYKILEDEAAWKFAGFYVIRG